MATALAESPILRLHRDDNIAIAKRTIRPGTVIDDSSTSPITVGERVEIGHKVAVVPIARGAAVRKYGQIIGYATADIQPGQWVHTQNVEAGTLSLDYAFASDVPPDPTPVTGRTFLGYRRPDGRAATRNYIGIVSTVNCSAATSRAAVRPSNSGRLSEHRRHRAAGSQDRLRDAIRRR
jgi:altronate hydrolase